MRGDVDRAYLRTPASRPAKRAAPAGPRSLAVLIVSYRSHELLEKCLGQVAEHLPELPVYAYENSGDDYPGRHELVARHPDVHWVVGPTNVGFAAAVNTLAEHTPPHTDLLLLNPDVRLLGPLTRSRLLIHQRGVAAVAPLMLDDHGAGGRPWDVATRRRTLTRALVAAAGYSDRLRGTPLSHLYRSAPRECEDVGGYLCGACLLINRDAWDDIGGFDEEFFLYGEETDWQNRAHAAGWRVLLADELGARHGDDPSAADPRPPIQGRTHHLLRANIALLLEHEHSVHHGDAYLVGTTVLDRMQRSKRISRRAAAPGRDAGRPHIVITTNRLVYGGAERQKVLLATELDRRGYPVTLVCMQRFGPLVKELPPSVQVVRQPWFAPVLDGVAGPAVLIGGDTNTETGFATLWRAAGRHRRWLVGAHVPPAEDGPIYSRGLAAAMRRADGFVALAHRHWDQLAAHHRLGQRYFVAPNGVGHAGPPTRRPRCGPTVNLVMLSRIVEHKNPHLLIEALSDLPELPWRLTIFGDGPDRLGLAARTPPPLRDRVHWRGWSDGPDPAFAHADLLCVPSRSEAFPLVIVEAMARAVPVAASGVCAVPEMLDHGAAGFVVDPVSVDGWRGALERILADPTALPEVGRRGHERMSGRYTVEAMTDAYLDAIGAVL
ncbi:glycosyltransferase [Mycobacterium sp. IDR2000157661]|uniref:glycosyltransferase n=1 Tax=Mycobacterium sp. IDR2000157661 TaxID=2867005 RepID=UPI001EECF339|nr:glycosyltransferase [Mycobacterium sp. IDR2000157661]ULE32415.1 glycosyltransferase [Mycobacterium sp. IDR2000157661]